MVGYVLDGRERGPGARAFAEDLARQVARDSIQTYLLELVPTPSSAPRLLHSIRRPESWLRREEDRSGSTAGIQTRGRDTAHGSSTVALGTLGEPVPAPADETLTDEQRNDCAGIRAAQGAQR